MKKILLLVIVLHFGLTGITAQTAQTVFLAENFEGGNMPVGWTQTTLATDGGWKFGFYNALQSTYFPVSAHTKFAGTNDDVCNCNKSADRLITLPMDLSSAAAVVVKFEYYYLAFGELATVEVSVDSGSTWLAADTLPPSGIPTSGYYTQWSTHFSNITAIAAGHPYVLVSFKYNDLGTWEYGLAIDDVTVYQPVAADAALSKITPTAYSSSSFGVTGDSVVIGGTITNYGATGISNCVIKWSDGTNIYPYTLPNAIPVAGSFAFIHPQPYHISSMGMDTITMWVELPNDTIHNNDTVNTIITEAAFIPVHKVTIEDQTICSTGNGIWCPRGIVYIDSFVRIMGSNAAEIISVHDADPMQNTSYYNGSNSILNGVVWPEIQVDRKSSADPLDIFNQFSLHANDFGVANIAVSMNYDTISRYLFVSATAHFAVAAAPATGRYNLALVLTEDSVHSSNATYAQQNVYAGGANGPLEGGGINFATQPNVVPADSMYYMHVARAILNSFTGTTNSLDSIIAENSIQTYAFPFYYVPTLYNAAKMKAIVLLINTTTNQIMNASDAPLIPLVTSGVTESTHAPETFKILPNPFTDETNLIFKLDKSEDVSLRVSDLLGETLAVHNNGTMQEGEHKLVLNGKNLSSGIYLVTLKAGDNSVTQKVVLGK